jgi:hypothetical protein
MFTDRIGLKVTALVLALMLWVIISAREPTEGMVTVRVVPVLDRSLVLADSPSVVRAQVYGRAIDIMKLYRARAELRVVVHATTSDSMVHEIVPSDVRLPERTGGEVRVLDVQPRSVTLHVAPNLVRR